MTREELKAAMSDLYAYAFADGRKSATTVRDEDAGDHCTLGFESWFEYVYAPIQLTPTLTLDPATDTRIEVDVSRREGMTVRHFGTNDAGGTEYRFPPRAKTNNAGLASMGEDDT
jgi:hypothetical protein